MMEQILLEYLHCLPKAELHLHIEGTLEPELMFALAARNNIQLKYKTVKELKNAYNFANLQEFLNLYYEGAGVLMKEQDFFDLTCAYLKKAHKQNIKHAEIFFDPQTHTNRGIPFETVINGIHKACIQAENALDLTSRLIMCFLRDQPQDSAMMVLKQSVPYKNWITAVGLDSAEIGNPPSKFKEVFEQAIILGYKTVAHAGEEGPADYIDEAVDLLKVSRVDHGNHCLDNPTTVKKLITNNIPLTVCPLSNLKLQVVKDLAAHPLKKMIDAGLTITINSDDPAYFGGYLIENYLEIAKALDLPIQTISALAKNSFTASFLSKEEKEAQLKKIDSFTNIFLNDIG